MNIETFNIESFVMENIEKSYKIVKNFCTLLEGEPVLPGIIALTLTLKKTLEQQNIVNVDQVCDLLKGMMKKETGND